MQCFVLMPFGSKKEYVKGPQEADFIYKHIILPAIKKALAIEINDRTVVREVDNSESGLITKAIIQRLAEAPLVIIDITGHNGNVFFEMGVRYSLSKSNTILIRQPETNIPFDLANFRHHGYEVLDDAASDKLAEAILATISAGARRTDSPVYEVFPALEVDTNTANESRMPWSDFKDRIDKIRALLNETYTAKTYRPDAIIGITKGGAAFADLLTQDWLPFHGATLALWADRESGNWFSNSINKSLLQGLLEFAGKPSHDLRVLLLDEVIASGVTYRSATKLITEALPECHLRFLPMVYRQNNNYERVSDRILWKHHAFNLDHDQINDIHLTAYMQLPWGKDIRRT